MRVIQVHGSDIGGGAETVVRQHHLELIRRGLQVQLLVGKKNGRDPAVDQIPFIRGPKGLLRTARWLERSVGLQNVYSPSFRRLDQYFAFEPNILHFHSLHGGESFADLAVLPRLSLHQPTVITLHDLWLMTGHCGHPLECPRWKIGCGRCPDLTLFPAISRDATAWNFRRRKRIFDRCRLHLITPSEWLKQQVLLSPILSRFPVTVIPNPVDTSVFCPCDVTSLRTKMGIGKEERTVLLIAQHLDNPYKGISDGVLALNSIDDSRLKVILVGHHSEEVGKYLKVPYVKLPFESNPEKIADYYRLADVLLMPSRGETFGLVAAEAMACGVPVVCPSVGGLPEVIGDDIGGMLVAPRDTQGMAAALHLLITDDVLRRRVGQRAHERATRLFCRTRHTEAVLQQYREWIDHWALQA